MATEWSMCVCVCASVVVRVIQTWPVWLIGLAILAAGLVPFMMLMEKTYHPLIGPRVFLGLVERLYSCHYVAWISHLLSNLMLVITPLDHYQLKSFDRLSECDL